MKITHPEGLNGPRGLLTAVIALAMADARSANCRRRNSARAYFASAVYRGHLQALGLPDHWLPAGVETLLARGETVEREPAPGLPPGREPTRRCRATSAPASP